MRGAFRERDDQGGAGPGPPASDENRDGWGPAISPSLTYLEDECVLLAASTVGTGQETMVQLFDNDASELTIEVAPSPPGTRRTGSRGSKSRTT